MIGTSATRGYHDQRDLDARRLTYTTPALTQPLEVTGHARLRVFMESSAPDGAVFAYLEDVWPGGRVSYVTEGQLRLIHRQSTAPASDLPPTRSYLKSDAREMVPGEVTEIVMDLLPTSYEFRAGHRIRLSIAGNDAANFSQPYPAETTFRFHRDAAHATRLELPVFPHRR